MRGFGAGRANELRIDLKTSSKGSACPMSGAPNKVKIDMVQDNFVERRFHRLTDNSPVSFEKYQFAPTFPNASNC